jgi:hypothetical protein
LDRALRPIFGNALQITVGKDEEGLYYNILPAGLIFRQVQMLVSRQGILGRSTAPRSVTGWQAFVLVTEGGYTEPEEQEEMELDAPQESLELCVSLAVANVVAKTLLQSLLDDQTTEDIQHVDTY